MNGLLKKGTETILLVDDEKDLREIGSEMLGLLGYTVFVADGGKEALRIYAREKDKINMVILDLMMPDIDGGATFDKLKELSPNVKAMLSSGYNKDRKTIEILSRGFKAFIQKPFRLEELSNQVRNVLEK